MLRPEDVAEACLLLLQLPRRAHIPELTILPTRLQSLGKTSDPNAKPS
jgi:NADP-dependent 3-hydroxy acid dehydrogenase YdfG